MNRREFLTIVGGVAGAAVLGIPPETDDGLRLGFVAYEEVGMIVYNTSLVQGMAFPLRLNYQGVMRKFFEVEEFK